MDVRILVFGACRDIIQAQELALGIPDPATVASLRQKLESVYPDLTRLNSLMIAVNNRYAAEDLVITGTDEIALIPPVSGG